jgi:hypothetical protein
MARKSRYWGSFWGETGRNTGKWVSNKVFGETGWATPKRHIMHNDGNKSRSKSRQSDSSDESDVSFKDHYRNERMLKQKASGITFNSDDVNEISVNLDQLITGANMAQESQTSVGMFTSKIRSGILRLRRIGEHEMADFYQKELNRIGRKQTIRIILLILVGIFSFGGMLFFAFAN